MRQSFQYRSAAVKCFVRDLFEHQRGRERERTVERLPALASALAVALLLPLNAAAQTRDAATKGMPGSGDLWEVTMKMEMPNMPMAMPPSTRTSCSAKNRKDEDFIPKDDNCKMVESNRAGSKYTYKMICSGGEPMTMNGEINFAATTYEGRNRISMKMDGKPAEMTQTFSGKRVGDCVPK